MPDRYESQLQQQVDALKARTADTRELYREVCALLFFQHGITPTTHRLYQLVRRGSMGTPAEVLRQFWASLREKSRVRLQGADLPPEVAALGGELVSQLWLSAHRAAGEGLAVLREDARQAGEQGRREADAARGELLSLREQVHRLQEGLSAAASRELEAARELATNQGRIASMTEMLRDTILEMTELRQQLQASQRDAARAVGEANALRVELGLSRRGARRKPVAGLPGSSPRSQEDLALDPQSGT